MSYLLHDYDKVKEYSDYVIKNGNRLGIVEEAKKILYNIKERLEKING